MDIHEAIKSTKKMTVPTQTVINIMYTARFVEQQVDAFKEHDLTMQQYNVLRILRGQQGTPANLSTIQERMIDKNSNTTRLVDKLIKKGWARRQQCKNNRRKVEISITEAGLDLLKYLDPITEANNREAVHALTDKELNTLNTLLNKIRN